MGGYRTKSLGKYTFICDESEEILKAVFFGGGFKKNFFKGGGGSDATLAKDG